MKNPQCPSGLKSLSEPEVQTQAAGGPSLIYCLFEAREELPAVRAAGIDGREVDFLQVDSVGAAVSRVDSSHGAQLQPSVKRVLAFERVVAAVHEDRAVLPMRFGSVLGSAVAVRNWLSVNQSLYRAALSRLRDCVEIGVRVMEDEEPPGKAEADMEPASPALSTSDALDPGSLSPVASRGRTYLLARRGEFAAADGSLGRSQTSVEEISHRLEGLFLERKTERARLAGKWVPSVFFLVPRGRVSQFIATFHQILEEMPQKLLLTGPWPPYNFTPRIQWSENP